jgi:hypothetical protein
MAWRNCNASLALIKEINARWPNRDRSSDGTIGDAAHATRNSDHNPWIKVGGQGVVRARDIDKDGIDAAWLAEYLRGLGARGDGRLTGGGYIIFNRRITVPSFSGWKSYTGSNPHTHHLHVSFSRNQSGFDSKGSWGISGGAASAPAPPAGGGATLRLGSSGPEVQHLQQILKVEYRSYAGHITVDGQFGKQTEDAVKEFQRRKNLTADGVVGPVTRRALGM